MANLRTTSGKLIDRTMPDFLTIYAPDGTPHTCSPVDAQEILASGAGYTATPTQNSNEQQPEQQPIAGDAASEEAQSAQAAGRQTGETIIEAALSSISRRRDARNEMVEAAEGEKSEKGEEIQTPDVRRRRRKVAEG